MTALFDEWTEDFRAKYHEQVVAKIKRRIKTQTADLIRLVKSKDIDVGEFADQVNEIIARISHLKRVLQSILSGDIRYYKDYLETCIRQTYTVNDYEIDHIESFCVKYNNTREVRLRKLKGCFLKKFSKY